MSAILVLILRVMLAACLYGFLALAIFSLWREFKDTNQLISERRVPIVILELLGEYPPQPRQFTQPEITIGRESSCDFMISDETVSAHHARLKYHHNQWWVEDLSSTNGSFLNGERTDLPTIIISGDDLRCGQQHLTLTINKL